MHSKTTSNWLICIAMAGLTSLLTASPASSGEAAVEELKFAALPLSENIIVKSKKAVVKTIQLNRFNQYLDGQWQGITVASDGNCYFASSTHAPTASAMFFKFNPRNEKLTVLSDGISKQCGEDIKKHIPQGKIHSEIIEMDGWLYFATHLAAYWPGAGDEYTGAHIIGYEMATGKFRDYGILREHYSIYSGIAIDRKRKYLYALAVPFGKESRGPNPGPRFYRLDLTTGKKTDFGQMSEVPKIVAGFYLFVDNKGNCWFSIREYFGEYFCARPDKDVLEHYKDVMPFRRDYSSHGKVGKIRGSWKWAEPLPGNRKCIFTQYKGGGVYLFDPTRKIGPQAFTFLANIGNTGLGKTLGKNRLYYVQRGNNRHYRDKGPGLHLFSLGLTGNTTPGIIDHGLITDQAGRHPWRIPALATDKNGKLYMSGDWYVNPKDDKSVATMRHSGGRYKYKFNRLGRGQMFGTIDIRKDLK